MDDVQGLDNTAWERWIAYRKAIKKPYKEVSLRAAAIKLAQFGEQQAEVVEQSISNQWQGLFAIPVKKLAPGEKPEKSKKQIEADDARHSYNVRENERAWDERLRDGGIMARLKLADALLARYTILNGPDRPDMPDLVDTLKSRVASMLREIAPAAVLSEPSIRSMVRQLFGEAGVVRLRDRAEGRA